MKKLLLLRHAQAFGTGIEQKLTRYGMLEAKKVGEFLTEKKIMPDMVICSSAVRAEETYNKAFEITPNKPQVIFEDNFFHASAKSILAIINGVSDYINGLMIIGHNPAINDIIKEFNILNHKLLPKALNNLSTGKLVVLIFKNTEWATIQSNECEIGHVYFPEITVNDSI